MSEKSSNVQIHTAQKAGEEREKKLLDGLFLREQSPLAKLVLIW